jgi:hypothetical protein
MFGAWSPIFGCFCDCSLTTELERRGGLALNVCSFPGEEATLF